MKTFASIERSRIGALRKMRTAGVGIINLTGLIDTCQIDHAKAMPKLRALLGELNQRIHEFNAYSNVLGTE